MSRGYSTIASGDGQWIRVRCILTGGGDKECILNIIGDKETLQHSLNVELLRSTDIRLTDRSLFFRNDGLSIHAPYTAFMAHSPSLQTLVSENSNRRQTARRQQSTSPVVDPIYLSFDNKDVAYSWNALLRSFAVPEVYGCEIDHTGLFRMWRQVNLTIMHARNLGASKKHASADPPISSTSTLVESERDSDSNIDSFVYCEVVIDGVVAGRTMTQKGQTDMDSDSSWTWLESFLLSDLPPFEILGINVWRCKKTTSKPVLIGTAEVPLVTFPRRQMMEGWYPVMAASTGYAIQVGDVRLKMKVDEETILPSEAYSPITSILDQHNCLDLLGELDQRMHLGDVSFHVLSIAVGRGTFLKDIKDLAEREVSIAPNANTLFRGNTIFTKTVEQAMGFFGRSFLEFSVGPSIADLCSDRVELETDPSRNTRGTKDVEHSVKQLQFWCQRFWQNIYASRDQCPLELRKLFGWIRELVEKRFGDGDEVVNLKYQSVSAFCFLRLIVPAILHPHLWGLHPGKEASLHMTIRLPSAGVQRSLTLIAKSLQSLANLSKEKKETHMQGVSAFLEQNRPHMIDYIKEISSPPAERTRPDLPDKYDRLAIMHSLRDRREQTRERMPLSSEAIPILPHLLDIPKHLAVLSSAVIRQSRSNPRPLTARPAALDNETYVEDFAIKCYELEAKVVETVTHLSDVWYPAATPHHPLRLGLPKRPSSPSSPAAGYTPNRNDPSGSTSNARESRRQAGRPASSTRPSTAPASSTNNTFAFIPSIPSPLLISHNRISDDIGTISPPVSPDADQLHASTSALYCEQTSVSSSVASNSQPTPNRVIRRTMSQQLDPQEIEAIEDAASRRRKKFLPGFLARSAK
ncbi:GTPase activating protein [Hysterangium stoloniferum]|nr:GTPase activating protein [Hysterangium stoloniferum]